MQPYNMAARQERLESWATGNTLHDMTLDPVKSHGM